MFSTGMNDFHKERWFYFRWTKYFTNGNSEIGRELIVARKCFLDVHQRPALMQCAYVIAICACRVQWLGKRQTARKQQLSCPRMHILLYRWNKTCNIFSQEEKNVILMKINFFTSLDPFSYCVALISSSFNSFMNKIIIVIFWYDIFIKYVDNFIFSHDSFFILLICFY